MPNYLLAYHGGGMAPDQAERDKIMAQWASGSRISGQAWSIAETP